jgi:hypothetical protein
MLDLLTLEKKNAEAAYCEGQHLCEEIYAYEVMLHIPHTIKSITTTLGQNRRLKNLQSLAASLVDPDEDWSRPVTLGEYKIRKNQPQPLFHVKIK